MVDLLRFIYTGDMAEGLQDPEDLIKMFLVADKFGVGACMKICLQTLAALPMTVATACLYLSLPDSMHSHRGVAHLLEASRLYLVSHFRDLERVYKGEEFLELPLVGLQTLLASDDLNVRDEVTAFSAMLEWVRHHEDDLESRRTAAAALAEYVRFPLMTGDDLEEVVLKAEEMASEGCAQLVKEAAWFRSYSLVRRLRLMNETGPVHRRFWQRKWNRNSVGYVYFDIHLERFQVGARSACGWECHHPSSSEHVKACRRSDGLWFVISGLSSDLHRGVGDFWHWWEALLPVSSARSKGRSIGDVGHPSAPRQLHSGATRDPGGDPGREGPFEAMDAQLLSYTAWIPFRKDY